MWYRSWGQVIGAMTKTPLNCCGVPSPIGIGPSLTNPSSGAWPSSNSETPAVPSSVDIGGPIGACTPTDPQAWATSSDTESWRHTSPSTAATRSLTCSGCQPEGYSTTADTRRSSPSLGWDLKCVTAGSPWGWPPSALRAWPITGSDRPPMLGACPARYATQARSPIGPRQPLGICVSPRPTTPGSGRERAEIRFSRCAGGGGGRSASPLPPTSAGARASWGDRRGAGTTPSPAPLCDTGYADS